MRRKFWRGKTPVALAIGLAIVAVGAMAGAVQAGSEGNGNGHTKVTLCHWVPAHGGSFVTITIDDDGLHGHDKHENDVIPAPAEGCPGGEEKKTPEVKKTVTATPAATQTVTRTATAVATNTATAAATNTATATTTGTPQATATGSPTATATGGVVDVPPGAPDLTPSPTNTVEATATPEGDVGADTATPEATSTTTPEGGVAGEAVTPVAGGAQALPDTGSGAAGSDASVYGLIGLAFAAAAGGSMLMLGRRLYR